RQQQAAAQDRGQAYREHLTARQVARPLPRQCTAPPDQVSDHGPLAVVAPVQVPRPVPVVGLIRSQIERAVAGQIGKVEKTRGDDEEEGQCTPAPAWGPGRGGRCTGHRHILACDGLYEPEVPCLRFGLVKQLFGKLELRNNEPARVAGGSFPAAAPGWCNCPQSGYWSAARSATNLARASLVRAKATCSRRPLPGRAR